MNTIIHLIQHTGSIIKSAITFRNTSFETVLSYTRRGGKQVEFVVVHVPDASGDTFSIPHLALSVTSLAHNPNCAPQALIQLSMDEARLLRDFLNREEVRNWLEG